jgi:hypothetical protein
MAAAVDHAAINVPDEMDAAAARSRDPGFTLTGRGHHALGSINRPMVFERDYLERIGRTTLAAAFTFNAVLEFAG